MANYDYKAGKRRLNNILNNKLDVIKKDKLPSEDSFTFDNGYDSLVSAIFVDIRDSSTLFADGDKEKVSKIIRSFTSEVIEILRDDDNLREIGIRGDCVYAVYTTPQKNNIYELFEKTWYINTYMKMLNTLLRRKRYPEIAVGIGMATARELVVKAGRKGVGINNLVWIGEAVTAASNLSSIGNKEGKGTLVYSRCSYTNFIDEFVNKNGDKVKKWFKAVVSPEYGTYYHADILDTAFDNWINAGMND
ncbi:MAG: adenylate cyclase [Defluviitaleaceae bacterium]|nr:adenylate cyclase [Defluviitaleaceae bacterium]